MSYYHYLYIIFLAGSVVVQPQTFLRMRPDEMSSAIADSATYLTKKGMMTYCNKWYLRSFHDSCDSVFVELYHV